MQANENELLTKVGPGTPMGELMRRYWIPALLSSEVTANGDPVRVRLLGENYGCGRDRTCAGRSAAVPVPRLAVRDRWHHPGDSELSRDQVQGKIASPRPPGTRGRRDHLDLPRPGGKGTTVPALSVHGRSGREPRDVPSHNRLQLSSGARGADRSLTCPDSSSGLRDK
jgi:hypothetical protein